MSNKSGRKMTRDEVVKTVTESGDVSEKSYKKVIMPPSKSADFKKISKSMNLKPDSKHFKIIKVFCDKKDATSADTKVLVQRIKGFN
ncbi:hypothetical protein QUF70_09200, partial [Desulfobacterales bacterium HSG17]|nr:hypothetical protein [Desulfobacterales bacterium HSG17]